MAAPYLHDGSTTTPEGVIRGHDALQSLALFNDAQPDPMRDRVVAAFESGAVEAADLEARPDSLADEQFFNCRRFADLREPRLDSEP